MGLVATGGGIIIGAVLLGCGDGSPPATAEQVTSLLPSVGEVEPGSLFRGAFLPDASEFYFFVKVTEGEEDYRVLQTHHTSTGWSEPTMLALGDSNASSMILSCHPMASFLCSRPIGPSTARR
jgi:hypothetical protein